MIICDRCSQRANYILNIDYNGHENFDRMDLCESCFNRVQAIVKNDAPPVNEKAVAEKAEVIAQHTPPSPPPQAPAKPVKRRGRPPKN